MRSLTFAISLFFWISSASADVVYEFRETITTDVVGVMTLESPPASATSGWGAGSSGLISLLLNDALFGLGSGNLLFAGSVGSSIFSFNGSALDGDFLGIDFPPTFPANPLVLSEDKVMSLFFLPLDGQDVFAISTVTRFTDGSVLIADLFVNGDWRVQSVAAPNTLILFAVGLLLLSCFRAKVRFSSGVIEGLNNKAKRAVRNEHG